MTDTSDIQNNNEFPLEMVNVEPKLADELMKYFTGERTGFVLVGPKRYFFPNKYREEAANIYNLPLRPSDVFVDSYPRSGTTWTQELVWMVANDLDYDASFATPLTSRYSFLEFPVFIHPSLEKEIYEENKHNKKHLEWMDAITEPGTKLIAGKPSPRFIKTHIPLSLLPPKLLDICKMVYVARDPRDVAVSFYHLNRSIRTQGYTGDFKSYWTYFRSNMHHWTPYFEHIKEAWAERNNPNMLFLLYEEMSKNLPAAVRRVAKFFGKQFTDEQVEKLCKHLSIDSFKNNASVNYDVMSKLGFMKSTEANFIRKGKAGGWRDHFDDEMTEQAQQWIDDNLRDTDFRFPHMQDN